MSTAPSQLSAPQLGAMIGLRRPIPAQAVQWTQATSPDPAVDLFEGKLLVDDQGTLMPCLLLRPRTAGPKPAVIAIHQHNDEYQFGKSEPAGLAGDPHTAYGLALAQHGFLVAIPDLMGFEDRGSAHGRTGRELELLAMNAVANGHSLHGTHVSDVLAVANYLEAFEEIQGDIAVAGHSLGGQLALLILALDARFKVGVISSGLTTIAACKRAGILHNAGWYLPGLEQAGDYQAIARMIANKKILSVSASASHDEHFPATGARDVLGVFADGVVDSQWRTGAHALDEETLTSMTTWLAANHSGVQDLATGWSRPH